MADSTRKPTEVDVLAYQGPTHNADGKLTVNASQHLDAVRLGKTNPFGGAMMMMLRGWEGYRNAHRNRYECRIGEDHVMGEYWAAVGLAIKRLLDGECGGLDCGSVAHNILASLDSEGFEHDGYNLIEKPE